MGLCFFEDRVMLGPKGNETVSKYLVGYGIAAMVVAASPVSAEQPDASRVAVQGALDASAAAWNAADLDRFMTVYENAADTVYIGGGKMTRGYTAIRDMYAARFGGGSAAAMGQLSIEILDFRMPDRDHAFVVGRFHLHRVAEAGGDASGMTTLLFRRGAKGWHIVADHS